MNTTNILLLANTIEQRTLAARDIGFNMARFFDHIEPTILDHSGKDCHTVACIAGHAAVLAHPDKTEEEINFEGGFFASAQEWLDLTSDQANELFYLEGLYHLSVRKLEKILPEEAVAALRRLAATGKVTWDEAITRLELLTQEEWINWNGWGTE